MFFICLNASENLVNPLSSSFSTWCFWKSNLWLWTTKINLLFALAAGLLTISSKPVRVNQPSNATFQFLLKPTPCFSAPVNQLLHTVLIYCINSEVIFQSFHYKFMLMKFDHCLSPVCFNWKKKKETIWITENHLYAKIGWNFFLRLTWN